MINNYLERQIKENFPYQPTPEQEIAIKSLSDFLLAPRSETVFLLRGYAGTGKTSLVGALVRTLDKLQQKSVLLAPTGLMRDIRRLQFIKKFIDSNLFPMRRATFR
jgi:exodeoxyribonuclease-5